MRTLSLLFAAVACALCACATGANKAAPTSSSDTTRDLEAIDQRIEPYVGAGDFMGVIGIGINGEAPIVRSYGYASLELDAEHTAESRFMIGSISKQFTAAAILLLEEDGLLATDSRVAEYLPDFPHGGKMTVAQLVDHTAGVWDIYSLKSYARGRGLAEDFDAVLAELYTHPLTSEPGTRFQYSNGGYALLAAIVERVSGKSYATFLRARIFDPLGMDDTLDGVPGPIRRDNVSGYDPWGIAALTAVDSVPYPYLKGSGSLWSSAKDMLTWSSALHGGRVLQPDSYDKFIQKRVNGYGYGVSIFDRAGRKTVGHDGRVSGFASDLAHYLDEDTAIVVLSNVQSVARDAIRNHVAAVVFGVDFPPPTLREYADSPGQLDEYEGDYAFFPGFVVYLRARQGRLMAAANEGGWSELVPLTDGTWFSRMLYATVRFERDQDGRVSRLVWGTGEGAPAGTRQSLTIN